MLGLLILMVCGNGWLVRALTEHLEHQYPPLGKVEIAKTESGNEFRNLNLSAGSQLSATNSQPKTADCILVLSGGLAARIAPRPTLEVGEAGDRILYAAHLFKQGRAPRILCTGNVATGGIARRPASEDMAEFLEFLGVPRTNIVTETGSENTHQHGANLQRLFREQSIQRVLLVTSAMHMPRSMGVFRRSCPGVEFIAAPTDFRITERLPAPWYRELTALVPTPSNLQLFSEVMHEYLGLAYYRLRGWTLSSQLLPRTEDRDALEPRIGSRYIAAK